MSPRKVHAALIERQGAGDQVEHRGLAWRRSGRSGPRISPATTSKLTPSTATSPPKRRTGLERRASVAGRRLPAAIGAVVAASVRVMLRRAADSAAAERGRARAWQQDEEHREDHDLDLARGAEGDLGSQS